MSAVLAAWERREPNTRLWVSQKGEALQVRSIAKVLEELVASCAARGLVPTDTSAHTLRHTFAAIYLLSQPGDLVGLAALLGHTSPRGSKGPA